MTMKSKRRASRKLKGSLLDDEALEYVSDDGDTDSSGDICAVCGLVRSKHDEDSGQCSTSTKVRQTFFESGA